MTLVLSVCHFQTSTRLGSCSREYGAIQSDELLDREWRLSGNFLDDIVGTCEDAVAVVLSNLDQMLREERRKFVEIFHLDPKLLDGTRLVFDPGSERFTHRLGDLGMVHLDGTMERIDLALVAFGVGQDMGDHPPLIISGDGCVTAIAKGKFNLFPGPDLLRKMRIDEPIGKKRGAEMGSRNARPIEDPLGNPVILGRVAFRLPARGNLRHVDDRLDVRLLCGLREISSSPDDSWRDRMEKIGRPDSFHGCADVIDVGEVSDGDIDSALPQGGCPIVVGAHIRAHAPAHLEQFVDSNTSGPSGCTAHKYFGLVHGLAPFGNKSICSLVAKIGAYASIVKAFLFVLDAMRYRAEGIGVGTDRRAAWLPPCSEIAGKARERRARRQPNVRHGRRRNARRSRSNGG
ncbi:hypothetical protein EMIT0111MI5_80260 [Burkholderia sp. IT-111MI5]